MLNKQQEKMVIELGQMQNRSRGVDHGDDTPTVDDARNTYLKSNQRLGASRLSQHSINSKKSKVSKKSIKMHMKRGSN